MKTLKEIVGFWSEYSTQRMIRKSKVDQFKNYTDKAVLINVFDTMKSYLLEKANLKNRLRRFQKGLRIKTQKQFLVQWRINFRKSIIHSEQEAIADQMYKTTHLRLFYTWHEKFVRYQQLNQEDKKLENYQNSALLRRCLDALSRYKDDQKWKKAANTAANEERSYWLAKRAFQGWSEQIDKMSQKNKLYKLLTTHYHFSLKKNALLHFKSFVNFKMEQRYNDMVVVSEIIQLRQKNVFESWRRVQLKRQAVKQLTYHSEKAVKALVLRNMINRYNYQNSALTYMQSQRHYYIELTGFNRLKSYMHQRKNIESAKTIIDEGKDHWQIKKAFMHWLRKYRTIQKHYKTYAFLAIQIKNAVAKDCFTSLKVYSTYKKNKRIAEQYYKRQLKQKLLNTMYNTQAIAERDYNATYQISTKQSYTIKNAVLHGWREVFLRVHNERVKVEDFMQTKQNIQISSIFTEWKDFTRKQVKINAAYSELKSKVDSSRLERGFSKFTSGVKLLQQAKEKNSKADAYYMQTVCRKVNSAWWDRVMENRTETQKIAKIRNMRRRKLVSKCWEFMLNKTEDKRMKIRHVRKVTKIPVLMQYRQAFEKWGNFVADQRDIQDKVEELKEHFRQKRLAYALNKMVENHVVMKERKQKEDRVAQYYFSKQAIQIFDMFKVFLEIRREKRYKQQLAMRFRAC